jgi:hypothetical protein
LHLTEKRYTTRNSASTPVKVYSNLSKVGLSVNGTELGMVVPDALRAARWEQVDLVEGENQIVVTAVHEGRTLRDEAVWIFDPVAPPPGAALAKPKSVVQGLFSTSAAENINGPRNAFDGNPDTRWSTSKKGTWLAREFLEPTVIDSIGIEWYKGIERNYDFEVDTSTDGNTWRPAFKGKSRKQGGVETYAFDTAYELTHIRIVCNGHSNGRAWSSIIDVKIK